MVLLPVIGSSQQQSLSSSSSTHIHTQRHSYSHSQLSSSSLACSSLGNDLAKLLPSRTSLTTSSETENLAKLCDVTLIVGGVRFFASRAVLASRSPYFRSLFLNGMRESHQNEIELHNDCDAKTFESILHWIYTDTLNFVPPTTSLHHTTLTDAWKLWQACVFSSLFFSFNFIVF
jgi:hypothetical protein